MIAVWSLTGRPFLVGGRTFHPVHATLVDELSPEARLQAPNLRTMEVSGPDDPALDGVGILDDEGSLVAGREGVSPSEHAAVVQARDELDGRLVAATTAKETAETELATVRSAREAAERSVAALTTELGGLKGDLQKADEALERNGAELTAAAEKAARVDAERKQAIADLKSEHERQTKAAAEKAKAAHDELVAKHKAEVERLKGEISDLKKPK